MFYDYIMYSMSAVEFMLSACLLDATNRYATAGRCAAVVLRIMADVYDGIIVCEHVWTLNSDVCLACIYYVCCTYV